MVKYDKMSDGRAVKLRVRVVGMGEKGAFMGVKGIKSAFMVVILLNDAIRFAESGV